MIVGNTSEPFIALSERLRAETRPEHDAIESALGLPHSIQSTGDYTQVLAGFYGFYLPLEQALLRLDWEGTGIDPHKRLKAPLLRADLEACGTGVDSLPRCRSLPPCNSLAAGFGCLYVMEGATLGGAIIHRELGTRFGEWLTGKAHFHQCYGAERGPMWRRFKQALDCFGEGQDGTGHDRIIQSARATFHTLQSWLEAQANA